MTSVYLQQQALITVLFSGLLSKKIFSLFLIFHQSKNLNLILLFKPQFEYSQVDKDNFTSGVQAGRLSFCLRANFVPGQWPLLFFRCKEHNPPVNYLFHTTRCAEIKHFLFFLSLKFRGEHYAKVSKLSFVSPAVHFIVSFQ